MKYNVAFFSISMITSFKLFSLCINSTDA